MSGIGFIKNNRGFISKDNISNFSDCLKLRGNFETKKIISKNYLLIACHDNIDKENNVSRIYDYNGQYHILFDGRIDNKRDLIKEFNLGINISTIDLILSIYMKIGNNISNYLSGAFAIIIYDKKSNELFAIRDHMGMQPLYYFYEENFLVLSSNIKSILSLQNVNKVLNKKRLIQYINNLSSSEDNTFFEKINKIPKASYISVKGNNFKIKKYFEFDATRTINLKNDEEYSLLTKEKFSNVIRNQSSNFNKIACKLSGGLDSSAIASFLAQELNHKNFNCYSIIYEDDKSREELPFMNGVVNKFKNIDHKLIELSLKDFNIIDTLVTSYKNHDQVLPSFNRNFELAIFKEMNLFNDNVIFDGFDGDSSISFGLEKFILLSQNLNLFKVLNERKKYATKHKLKFSYKTSLLFFSKHASPRMYKFFKEILEKDTLSKKIFKDEFSEKNKESYFTRYQNEHQIHKDVMLHDSWDYILEFTEQDASINGIAELYPFFDKDFMQYLISIPVSQKLKNGESRYHFRNAVNGIVPHNIQNRFTKGILSSLWIQAVKNISKVDRYDFLLGQNSPIKDIFNYREAKELLNFDTNIQMNDAARAQKLFSLISLSIWMQENDFRI